MIICIYIYVSIYMYILYIYMCVCVCTVTPSWHKPTLPINTWALDSFVAKEVVQIDGLRTSWSKGGMV